MLQKEQMAFLKKLTSGIKEKQRAKHEFPGCCGFFLIQSYQPNMTTVVSVKYTNFLSIKIGIAKKTLTFPFIGNKNTCLYPCFL